MGRALARAAAVVGPCAVLLVTPPPADLSVEGQRVLAVTALAVGLWGSEALPAGITGIAVVVALVLARAVPGVREALVGFADPVAYFLIGVLTIGLAVSRSGLAERVARLFLRGCRGRPRVLYLQLLAAFPLLTLLLPSATTRTGILVHVYDRALELSGVPPGAPLARAVMMALNSVNRLASTVLLTGGITPIVAAGLIGGISWARWFALMSVPYAVLLVLGAGLIYLRYRHGFEGVLPASPETVGTPLSATEWRTAIITAGASLLWLTDALHPALPAMIAWVCLLTPRIGVLSWGEFERGVGWASFTVIASSLSLAQALVRSGASRWLASLVVHATPGLGASPLAVVVLLLVAAAVLRLLIPNITGFLATTIPVAMSIGVATGLNPLVCGLVVTIAGDAVLYYPAQSASSLVVYQRGHLSAPEIFRFGLWMTGLAALVVLAVALPYWSAIGEPLRP
jgi:anion transporter